MSKFTRQNRQGSRRFSVAFIKRLSSWLVLSTALTVGTSQCARAATFVWDPDANAANNIFNLGGVPPTATNLGGVGAWDTGLQWWNGTTDQAWNNAGLDTAWFAGLSGGAVTPSAAVTVGGLTFSTGGYTTVLTGANTITLDAGGGSPIIAADANVTLGTAAINGILGTAGFTKNGGGTLTIVGSNTGFSGGVSVNGGALTLSGTSTSTSQLNNSTITLNFGTLNFRNDGTATPGALAYGNDVVVNGNSTISVDRAAANSNNTITFPTLTVNNSAVTFTSGNGYGLQVTGATTLFGAITTLNSGFNPLPSGAAGVAASANNTAQLVALTGAVGGSGALNKQGAGTVTLQALNTYSGGTNILAGSLLLNTNAATLGGGKVIVNPGTTLGIVSNANVTGANLYLASSSTSAAILRANANTDLSGGTLNAAIVSPYGASFQLDTGTTGVAGAAGSNAIFNPATGAYAAATTYSQNIDLNNFGSTAAGTGRIMLGSTAANTTMSGTVSNTAGGSTGDIRFGGTGNLILTSTNVFGTTAQTVQVGSPIGNAQPFTGGAGTLILNPAATNSGYTGTVIVNKGATLQSTATSASTFQVFGTGSLTVLGGTVSTTNTNYLGNGTNPQIQNSAINLYANAGVTSGAGALFTLDNNAITAAGTSTNVRLVGTTPINAYGGSTFSFVGSNTAATTQIQNTGAYGFQGGNVINLTSNATAASNSDTVLTIANLVRNGNGTMTFTRAGTTQPANFGLNAAGTSDSRVILTQLNGVATAATATAGTGMLPAWLVDQTSSTFLTYGANGIAPVVYNDTNFTAPDGTKVATATGALTPANPTVFALQITGTTGMGGSVTINPTGAPAADGSGLIISGAATHTTNFTFGAAGAREAVIFNSAAVTLSGTIAATGLTKFGGSNLTLSGVNAGLAGAITVNQGALLGSTTGYNFRPITLAGGGQLDFSTTANGIYLNDVTVTGESLLSGGANTARINSLTIAPRLGTATAPVTLMLNNGYVVGNYGSTYVSGSGTSITGGGLTLSAPVNWVNGSAASGGAAGTGLQNILGVVSGGASNTLNKWGSAALSFSNAGNTYSGGTVINGAGGDNRGPVRSLVGTTSATPFGSGSITVNPAGVLTLSAPDNASTNALIVNSDLAGLGMVSLQYGGSAALPTFASTTFNNGNLGVAFSGVLGSEAVGFSTAINLNTLWGGTAFLGGGNSGGTVTPNFTGALTPSTVGLVVADLDGGAPVAGNSVYRIGAGGGSSMQFTGAANQFTGATDLQVGAISNVTSAASVGLQLGNALTGIYNSNNLSGKVYLNTGILIVGRNDALGTAKIVFNGGTIQADTGTGLPFFNTTRTLTNAVGFTGDGTFAGSTDLTLSGAVSLADNQSGVTRTITVSNTAGLVRLTGAISNGAGTASGNSLTKAGAGALVLGTNNTYTGFTNINAGTLVVTGDSNIPTASKVTLGGGQLGAWTQSFTTSRDYILTANNGGFDVGPGITLTQQGPAGAGAGFTPGSNISGAFQLAKNGLGTLILNGINSFNGGNAVQLNNGILQVSGSANLGDTATNGQIVANTGALRASDTFTMNRVILPNTNATTSITLDVVSGATLTSTARLDNNGSGVFSVIKTGLGTFETRTGATASTELALVTQNGTFLVSNTTGAPFGAAANLQFNGGTYQQTNTTANQAYATSATLSYGGGGHVGLQSGAGFSSQLQSANLTRSGAGTLIIDPGTGALAVAGAGAGAGGNVRLIPTTLINTVAVASANVNGMLPANIVTQVSGIGGFSTRVGATGIGTFSAFSNTFAAGNLGATTNTSTVDVTTAAITTFSNATSSVYALRTDQDVAGGTLRISSINGTTATNQGGLIINGSRTIGANLIFDPTANSGGSAASGEGLIYVNPSSNAIVSGAIHGTSLVKFGSGNLQLSGASTGIINALTVQEGTLTLGGGLTFNKMQTDLVLNNTGTLDLGGQRLTFNSLSNGAAVTGTIAGGNITNSSGSAATFVVGGNNTTLTTFAGNITQTSGTISLVKSGLGTLVLAPFNIANPEAGNNSFTGGTVANQGILTVQDPRALGSGTLTLQGAATVNFNSNGPGINSTIITGTPGGLGLNVVNNGNATLATAQVSANSGNVMQFNNLALNEGQLTLTGGNSYRVRFNGTTTIAGGYGTLAGAVSDFVGAGELAGLVTGSGALVKQGSNYFKGLILSGTANDYSGGTQIQSGYLQVTSTDLTDTPLGSGPIRVYPGAALRIGANNTSIATNLQTLGRWNSFGIVALDNDNFNPATTLTSTSFSNAYGSILAITRPFYAGTLDQSTIGDGRSILAGGLNQEVGFLGTLAPGLGDGVASRTYRLAGGNNLNAAGTLAIIGTDNILTDAGGATSLQVGARNSIVVQGAVQNSGNTVIIRNSNSYTGGTWVGKGITLQIETGASPAGSTPLGSSTGALNGAATNVEVFGVLQNSGFGSSYVNALTGRNSITTTIRPAGGIIVNDQLGIAAGGQGRWADSDANGGGVSLGNGFFQYSGAAGLPSVETIGTLAVTGAGRVIVNRPADAGTATLFLSDVTRTAPAALGVAGGTLTIEPRQANAATGSILGIPNLTTTQAQQAAGFVRLITNGAAPTLGGTTVIGTGVTAGIATAGMAPAWIIDAQANSFVTYNPTAANTGFQPLQSVAGTFPAAGAQNPGQVGYNKVITTTLVSGNLAAGDIVDLTTAGNTLADPTTTIYALRASQSLNATTTNNTLNITSGGLLFNNGAAVTINAAATAANARPVAMSLQFGGGTGEGFIYKGTAFDATINANISASALTLFANQGNNNTLVLTGNNAITGPITVNTRIIAQNILSNTGADLGGVFSDQDVILGGTTGSSRDNNLIRLTGVVDDATGGGQASNSAAMSLFNSTFYINGESRIDNNSVAITQRILNLTVADRGMRSPIALALSNGVYVQGTTTLGTATSDTALFGFFDQFAQSTLGGLVQGGRLSKFGNGTTMIAGTANTFAGLTVYGHDFNTATSIVGSLTATGSPFGSGAILVNPGGALRIMNASNIASNSSIKVNTDGMGLGSIGVSTNLTQAQLNGLFGTGAGNVEMASTHANYIGALTLDANSWNRSLDIAALEAAIGGSKKLVIGTTINPLQTYYNNGLVNYYAPAITSSSDNVIRLGAGGNQGNMAFGVGTFENVFGAGKNIEIGAATAANGAAATPLINGYTGTYALNNRNTAFNGTVTVNPGAFLSLENAYALGSGTIVLNQNSGTSGTVNNGGFRVTNSQTITNPISVLGDVVNIYGGGDNAALNGNVNLNPTGGVGGTKQFGLNSGNNATSNAVGFNGIISGTGVSIIKTGGNTNNGGSYIFRGANTYTGTTTINSGYLFAAGNVSADPTVAGPFGRSDTPIVLGNVGTQSAGSMGIAGQYTFARGIIATGNVGNIAANVRGQTLNGAVITGGIAITQAATAGGGLALDNTALTTGFGGVLDVQGPITGTGTIQIGNGSTGTVRLSANANGVSTSTFAGGLNIWGGRVQVAANASFTGTAASPTIITSPFGTGTLSLGRRGTTTAGSGDQNPTFVQIDPFGGDRIIVNALGVIGANTNTTLGFGGRDNLTFTNTTSWDINAENSANRTRTFNVTNPLGLITFNSPITSSAAAFFTTLAKSGAGTLVLTGANTIPVNTSGTGDIFQISGGVLRITNDNQLGAISTTANRIAVSGTAGGVLGRLELAGANTVTWDVLGSNRQLSLGGGGQGVIVSDAAGVLVINTAVVATTSQGLSKEGAGTLRLNNSTNPFGNLTIGGVPTGGGTVSTTATSGTPFGAPANSITIGGGVLSLINTANAAPQTISTTTVEVRAGSYIQLTKGAANGSTLAATTSLTRGTMQGTLTLLPSLIANLGSAAANSENFTAANFSGASNTNGMLTLPFVTVRLAGAGQDANFVQYGTNGFTLHGATTVATLDGGLATDNTKLGQIDLLGVTAAAGINNVYALRTEGNIAPTDGTTLVGIGNGGLIINGATAPTISANLAFGTVAAGPVITPTEAIVYVRDGQTGGSVIANYSTLSGSFTATNFTKSGPGNLLISGTGNVMAPSASALRVLQINEGTLQFAGQSSVPSGGLIYLNPMDVGALDLNGQGLTFAALGANTTGLGVATGTVRNTGAAAVLTLNGQTGVNSQFNGQLNGTLALVKSGIGTQILGASNAALNSVNTYNGGTTVNAGRITSGGGLFTAQGALTGAGMNAFGTGAITLAGGQINFNSILAASEVDHALGILTQGPGNGYDVTIAALNNFGGTNTTSTLSNTLGATPGNAWQGIGSLNVLAPVVTLSVGSTTANQGILVKGQTTFAGDSTINVTGSAILSGKVAASGFALTKIGGQALFLTNTELSTGANAVGSWNVMQGTLEARLSDGSTNPLGTNALTLNGATLNLRHDGDNLADPQTLTTFGSTDITVGSTEAITSAGFISSTNSTLDTRTLSGGANKTIQIDQIVYGGALGAAFLSYTGANTYSLEVTGGITMTRGAYLGMNNNQLTISGGLSGNGTFMKQGGGELLINTVATNTGGTMLFQGNTNFGSFAGQTRTLSDTAKFAGDITVNVDAAIRFNSTGNLASGQRVDARGNLNYYPIIGLGSNEAVSAFGIRAPLAGGVFNGSMVSATTTGAAILGINHGAYTQALNLNSLGDGTWFLGTNNNAAGLTSQSSVNGVYTGAAAIGSSRAAYNFGVGSTFNTNNVYRLGAGGGNILTIGLPGGTANVLTNSTGTFVRTASLVIGTPATGLGAQDITTPRAIGNGTGTVILNTAQNYTGTTLVNIGSTLEFRGAMTTAGYDNYGTLAAGGSGGTFNGVSAANIVSRPGSLLRLDNTFDLPGTSLTEGRWGDATGVNLNSSTFRVIGNAAADLREVVGTVTVDGGAFLTPQRAIAGRSMEINLAGLTRGTGAMLSIEPTNGGQLGTDERVTMAGANLAAQIANIPGGITTGTGMVAPWLFNQRDSQFLTYSDYGFVNAGFNMSLAVATVAANTGLLTDRTLVTGAQTVNTGFALSTYALRMDASIVRGTATDATAQTIIASGGLIIGANNAALQTQAIFGSIATPTEAYIIVPTAANTGFIGDSTQPTTSGQISATAITKAGDGTLSLESEQQAIQNGGATQFTGPIYVNRGTLNLRTSATNANAVTATNTFVGGNGGTIFMNGLNTLLNLRSDAGTAGGATVFANSLSLGAGVLMARVDVNQFSATGGNTGRDMVLNNLTFGGVPGDQGQTLTVTGGNNFSLRFAGTTTLASGFNYFNVQSTGTNLTLGGAITGSGAIVAEGDAGTLFLGQNAVVPVAGWTNGLNPTGGLTLLGRTVQVNALPTTNNLAFSTSSPINNSLSYLGTGPVTLAAGSLNIRVDGDNTATARLYTFGNIVNVTGNSTIDLNRITGNGGSNKTIAFDTLNIGGQTLTLSNGNTFRGTFNNVNLSGFANLSVGSSVDPTVANVTDGGAQLGIIKNGGGWLYFNGAGNTFSGGLYVNPGAAIRFGSVGGGVSTTAKAGTGTIQINPGAQIILEAATNLNSGQLIDVRSASVSGGLGLVQFQTNFNPASLISSTSSGLLVMGTAISTPLDLALIGDGTFQLATGGDVTYSATTLGVGAGNLYRLGGNANIFRLTAANNNVLTGANRVQIGSLASGGSTFVFNTTNNYSLGTTISRGIQANFTSGGANTALGSNAVDVFGTLLSNGTSGSFVNAGGTANNYIVNLHPGSNLALGDAATNPTVADRWHDSTAIALNGSALTYGGALSGTGTETVGAISFDRGSRIVINNGVAKSTLTQSSGSPTRGGTGTLVFTGDDNGFGTDAANTNNFVFTGAAPTTANGMLPAYMINGTENTFLNVSGQRFVNATYTAAALNLPANRTAGTDIAQVSAATVTLLDNPNIYALGLTATTTINNAPGQLNTITVSGSGTGGGILAANAAMTINANIKSGSTGQFELPIFVNGNTTTLNGDITATGVTKFGAGTLAIGKDQTDLARGTGYSSGWVVNEGQLTPLTFGALGNAVVGNDVTLNGSTAGGANGTLATASALRLTANSGNPALTYYSMYDLNVYDVGTISYDPGADDRVTGLGSAAHLSDVKVTSTGGLLMDAQFVFATNRNRSLVVVGDFSLLGSNAGVQANVISSAQGSGNSSGLSVAKLVGASDTRLTKWGIGELYIRGASAGFSGAVSIEQGAIQINDLAGLGDNSVTNTVTVKRTGVLDLNVADFARTNVVFQAGSILRLSADDAIAAPGIDIGGASLQVGNDQSGTTTITMNGGSIQGYLRNDDLLNGGQGQAVYRTLGANVSIVLAGNSFLGQNILEGTNGLDNGRAPTVFSPTGNSLIGSSLEIKGVISGAGGLTKQGYDAVTLSGANTYQGTTFVQQGLLRLGATDALPTARGLRTTGNGVLDLNGYNQTVSTLTSPSDGLTAGTTNATGSGYITNTAAGTTNLLTVGNSTPTNAIYGGVIQYNVAVTKTGTNEQQLNNNNTYVGPTIVNDGTLKVGVNGAISGTASATVNAGFLTVNGSLGTASNLAPVSVLGTGTLNGTETTANTGTVYGPVTASGATATVSPGDPLINSGVGKLNTGAFTATTGATLSITLGASNAGNAAPTPGTDYSQLVTPSVSLDNSIALTLGNAATNQHQAGSIIYIVSNTDLVAPVSGTFGFGLSEGSLFTQGGTDWLITYQANWTGSYGTSAFTGGNDIALMAVPEPNALAMLMGSLGMALGLQRFRRRRQA